MIMTSRAMIKKNRMPPAAAILLARDPSSDMATVLLRSGGRIERSCYQQHRCRRNPAWKIANQNLMPRSGLEGLELGLGLFQSFIKGAVKLQGLLHGNVPQGHHDAAGPGLLKGPVEHPFSLHRIAPAVYSPFGQYQGSGNRDNWSAKKPRHRRMVPPEAGVEVIYVLLAFLFHVLKNSSI
jgi:hypothetical protein